MAHSREMLYDSFTH